MSTTMTSTVFMPQQTVATSSIMLPSSSTDMDGSSRVVRFDSECILIPDRSKRPKMLSKSYSLPLWKKKQSHLSDSDNEGASTSSGIPPSPEETHIVLKVPIPRFISRSSRSPSRGRSVSSSPPAQPLSPCLVHRSPSTSPSVPHKNMRRTSLPLTINHRKKDDSALTIPLRACCPDCVPITEECLKEGEQWQEKFSRGARRRRSASLDNSDGFLSSSPGSPSTMRSHGKGFTAVTVNPSAPAVVISCSSPRYDKTSNFSITVDEVDKRRKSQEYSEEELSRLRQLHSSRPSPFHSPNAPFSSAPQPFVYRPHEKETSTSSTSSSVSNASDLSAPDFVARRIKSSPIQEEDEDQLFPLPSPRRTPTSSPSPSNNPSPSASPSPSAKASPVPSPHASTSCLASSPAGLSASKDSLLRISTGSETILSESLSRKSGSSSQALSGITLSSSPLSLTNVEGSIPERLQGAFTSVPRTVGSPTEAKNPKSLSLKIPTNIRTSAVPVASPTSPLLRKSVGTTRQQDVTASPLPIPRSSAISVTRSFNSPSSPSAFPTMPSSPSSTSKSPPQSPVSPGKARRPSFSLPSIKDALKGAGSDVLKGVSSIGGGGAVGSV